MSEQANHFAKYRKQARPLMPDGRPARHFASERAPTIWETISGRGGVSLFERFRQNALDAWREGTLAGGSFAIVNDVVSDQIADGSPELRERMRHDRARLRRSFEEMPGSQNAAEFAAAFMGQLFGSATTAESFIPGPKWMGQGIKGRPRVTAAIEQGVNAAVLNAAIDPVVQVMSMHASEREEYDPWRTLYGAGFGGLVGGGLGLALGRSVAGDQADATPSPSSPASRIKTSPLLVGDDELATALTALRSDPQFIFANMDQVQGGRVFDQIQAAAVEARIPTRTDPAATFVELYVANKPFLTRTAPELVRVFDAALEMPQFAPMRGVLDGVRSEVLRRQRQFPEASLEATLNVARQRMVASGRLGTASPADFHVMRRGAATSGAPKRSDVALPEVPVFRDSVIEMMRRDHGDTVFERFDAAIERARAVYPESGVLPFEGALETMRQKGLSARLDFDALLTLYVSHSNAWRIRDDAGWRVFRDHVKALDPQLLTQLNNYKARLRKPRRAGPADVSPQSGMPHDATPGRPEEGRPTGTRMAARTTGVRKAEQRAMTGNDALPTIQSMTRDLASALGFSIRQGGLRSDVPAFYADGVLRLKSLNDFPQIAAGAAVHVVRRLAVRDVEALRVFAQANARELSDVSGRVGDFSVTRDLDDGQRAIANLIYLRVMNPPLVNKTFSRTSQALDAFLAARDPASLEGLRNAADAYGDYIIQPSADAMQGRIVSGAPAEIKKRERAYEFRERGWRGRIASVGAAFYKDFVDDLDPIKRAVRALGEAHLANTGQRLSLNVADDAYKLARLSRGAHASGQMDLMHGVTPYGQTRPEGPSLSGALERAIGPTGWSDGAAKEFSSYLTSLRFLVEWERYFRGELSGPPDTEPMGSLMRLVDEAEAANPEWRQAAMEVSAWAKQLWRLKYESGLITKEAYEAGLQRPFYVPVLRDMSDVTGRSESSKKVGGRGDQGNVFRFKGSDRDIIDPIQSLMWDAYQTRGIIARNDVFKALDDLASQVGFAGRQIVERMSDEDLVRIGAPPAATKNKGYAPDGVEARETLFSSEPLYEKDRIVESDPSARGADYGRLYVRESDAPLLYGEDTVRQRVDAQFRSRLDATSWEDLRAHLNLADQATLPEIIGAARNAGYDGINLEMNGERMIYVIRNPRMRDVTPDNVRDQTTLEALMDDDTGGDGAVSIFRPGGKGSRGEPIIYVWRNGEKQALRLADGQFGRDMYFALTQMQRDVRSLFVNTVAKPSAVLRTGVTASPDFMVANLVRDQVSAWILTGGQFTPFKDAFSGLKSEFARDEVARLYNHAGGIMGGAEASAVSDVRVSRDINALRRRGYLMQKASFKGFFELTEVSETGTRLGLFKKAYDVHRKRGLSEHEAVLEAAYLARDYLDFNRRGARMLHARRMVTFLNAATQGLDKSVRTLITPYFRAMQRGRSAGAMTAQEAAEVALATKAWARVTLIGLMGLSLTALYKDDPEYEEISEYLRATHWMVKAGDTWVSIPKPFELAFLSNIFERTFEHVAKEDPLAMQRMRDGLIELVSPPTTSPVVEIAMGLYSGTDRRTGRPIVPEYMAGLEPALQSTVYNSELSKAIGQAINVSPAMVDYMITTAGGTLGRDFLSYSNSLSPDRPGRGWDDAVLTKRFIKDVSRGSESRKQFWSFMGAKTGDFTRAAATYRAMVDDGDASLADAYIKRLPEDQRAYALLRTHWPQLAKTLHPLERAASSARRLSAIRRELYSADTSLAPAKKAQVDDVLSRMAMVDARNALVTLRIKGWSGRAPMNIADEIEMLRMIDPTTADKFAEVEKAAKLPDRKLQATVWKEVKALLLKDGAKADIGSFAARLDLQGGYRRRRNHYQARR